MGGELVFEFYAEAKALLRRFDHGWRRSWKRRGQTSCNRPNMIATLAMLGITKSMALLRTVLRMSQDLWA